MYPLNLYRPSYATGQFEDLEIQISTLRNMLYVLCFLLRQAVGALFTL